MRSTLAAYLKRTDFGDLFAFLYILVFVRQTCWLIPGRTAAWGAAILIASAGFAVYSKLKESSYRRVDWSYVAVVVVPLALLYLLRLPFPDISFDVLNHRLIQSERSLNGPQLITGDFFPTKFPFNPSSDMLTGIARHILGYRLGTVISLTALLWCGVIADRILREAIRNPWIRSLGVLGVLLAEFTLLEVNTYLVDLLALPLLLGTLRLACTEARPERLLRDSAVVGLMAGASVALKLTNGAMAGPLVLLFLANRFSVRRSHLRQAAVAFVALALCSVAALAPHAIYIYRLTASPFFPMYNRLFRSPYFPIVNLYDGRWGPQDNAQRILWPVLSFFHPERLSELGVYSGRIALAILAALLSFVMGWRERTQRRISGVVLLTATTWSFTSGYIRYALFTEVAGGILVLLIAREIILRARLVSAFFAYVVASLPLALLIWQCSAGLHTTLIKNWGTNLSLISKHAKWSAELRQTGRDRDLRSRLAPADRPQIESVEVWVVASIKTNGIEALLNPSIPMVAINDPEYFDSPAALDLYRSEIQRMSGKRMLALAFAEDTDDATAALQRAGLSAGNTRKTQLPYFSNEVGFHVTVIEVLPSDRPGQQGTVK